MAFLSDYDTWKLEASPCSSGESDIPEIESIEIIENDDDTIIECWDQFDGGYSFSIDQIIYWSKDWPIDWDGDSEFICIDIDLIIQIINDHFEKEYHG
jgi:hypothetical protein